MITRIAHVCINARDLNRSIAFYEKILRLKRKFNFLRGELLIGAYFEICMGNYIEIFENRDAEIVNTGLVHLCLETDDTDELIRWLDKNNIQHTDKKSGCDNSFQIWINDPDGNKIEIHEYTPASAQLTGKDCQVTW